jgi:hypothetical protein
MLSATQQQLLMSGLTDKKQTAFFPASKIDEESVGPYQVYLEIGENEQRAIPRQ